MGAGRSKVQWIWGQDNWNYYVWGIERKKSEKKENRT